MRSYLHGRSANGKRRTIHEAQQAVDRPTSHGVMSLSVMSLSGSKRPKATTENLYHPTSSFTVTPPYQPAASEQQELTHGHQQKTPPWLLTARVLAWRLHHADLELVRVPVELAHLGIIGHRIIFHAQETARLQSTASQPAKQNSGITNG